MSSTLYKLYVSNVIKMARTLTIKSEDTADAMNRHLFETYQHRASLDARTWRYYLNLAGQYHRYDTMMTVTSLDTLKEINFTVDSMREHRATLKAYAYGSSYYEDLVKRYPRQEMLIRGILNPIDIGTAIAAKDHTILYYDQTLVESNEGTLIPDLQRWTDAYFLRWGHPAYQNVDDLYIPSVLAGYFAHLPMAIMNIRLANCKTEFAHSFHVWEYLDSAGRLGEYKNYFTTKQALWLYRNIDYLHCNAGKQETLLTLIEHVMTERGLPVGSYRAVHDLRDYDDPDTLLPTVRFARDSLNERDVANGKVSVTVPEMLSKELRDARDNPRHYDDDVENTKEVLENSTSNSMRSKVLESDLIDSNAGDVYPAFDIFLNEWVHKASIGYYRATIQVTNPFTGALLAMTPSEAFITWLYAINRTYGNEMADMTIPDVVAWRVRRVPLPSTAELRNLVESRLVPDDELQWIRENQADVGLMLSRESFFETCNEIHRYSTDQYYRYSAMEHKDARGQHQAAVDRCYETIECVLSETHPTFHTFFRDKGWYVVDLSVEDCQTLASDLLTQATGQDLVNVASVSEIQAAMVRFMRQMSSYTVQWVQTINSSTVKFTDDGGIRVGDDKTKLFAGDSIKNPGVVVVGCRMKLKSSVELDLVGVDYINIDVDTVLLRKEEIDVSLDMTIRSTGYAYRGIRNPTPVVTIREESIVEKITVTDLDGFPIVPITAVN